jgi:cell division protein FtsB
MTNAAEPPSSRLDRIEAILSDMAEVVVSNSEVTDQHNAVLTRLEEQTARNADAIERLTATTERLVAEGAQDRQQAAIDRQAFQAEIQRIWQYLLQQDGNGRGQ